VHTNDIPQTYNTWDLSL